MSVVVLRGDARALPLSDASVDLIVTSPPYWSLRRYAADGARYEIGLEPTPGEYLENLWAVTAECARVLKPSGSMFINLGDKYSQRDGQFGPQGKNGARADRSQAATYAELAQHRPEEYGVPPKSLVMLPSRFAIGCTDQLGLILRRDIIWHKLNPLPESVTDRCPTAHEYLFHLTKEPCYYAATDEIREPHQSPAARRLAGTRPGGQSRTGKAAGIGVGNRIGGKAVGDHAATSNPLGKLPGSVWSIPSEPLAVPAELGVDHYAAFPTEIPRRCILGWSPAGICVECGEGRRPVADIRRWVEGGKELAAAGLRVAEGRQRRLGATSSLGKSPSAVITGYSCACPAPTAPTRPAVVLDPFAGTGTTVLAADVLGRDGIGVDASHDYCRLARWRVRDPVQRAGAMRVAKPPVEVRGQGDLFGEVTA